MAEFILSKTDYLIYRDCRKNAWLKIHKPEIYRASELSEFEKSIIETGNIVEDHARQLFPGGMLIEGRGKNARDLTSDYIEKKTSVLFQPVLLKDNFLAASDILEYHPETDDYSIYEVKASSEIKEDTHLYDLAFQYIVLKKAGIPLRNANLMHLNSEYVRHGELELNKLFLKEDVTDKVKEIEEEVMAEMEKALGYINLEDEPAGSCDCIYKGRSKHCTTAIYSNPEIPEYGIHDIARIGLSKNKLRELVDSETFSLHDIPEHVELSEIQKNQVDAYVLDKPIISKKGIREELEKLSFPLYFLDYETFPAAIPRFDGFSPYQQIPFQFSLHVLESAQAEPKHFEFLHTGPTDPSLSFAENLKKNIGNAGTVIVWNKKFEMKINEQLGSRIPEMKDFINSLNSRVYDLMDVFSKQHYVHKDFKGSTSIKYVLPVLVPELTYKDLEIKEGGTATDAWNKMVSNNMTTEEKNIIASNLKEYCKLDTYAMYAIWKNLYEIIKT